MGACCDLKLPAVSAALRPNQIWRDVRFERKTPGEITELRSRATASSFSFSELFIYSFWPRLIQFLISACMSVRLQDAGKNQLPLYSRTLRQKPISIPEESGQIIEH